MCVGSKKPKQTLCKEWCEKSLSINLQWWLCRWFWKKFWGWWQRIQKMQMGSKEEHSQALCKEWRERNLSCNVCLVFFLGKILLLSCFIATCIVLRKLEVCLSRVSSPQVSWLLSNDDILHNKLRNFDFYGSFQWYILSKAIRFFSGEIRRWWTWTHTRVDSNICLTIASTAVESNLYWPLWPQGQQPIQLTIRAVNYI